VASAASQVKGGSSAGVDVLFPPLLQEKRNNAPANKMKQNIILILNHPLYYIFYKKLL
jgi:hypothetical protein